LPKMRQERKRGSDIEVHGHPRWVSERTTSGATRFSDARQSSVELISDLFQGYVVRETEFAQGYLDFVNLLI
jgi:hypothetical protein